MTYQFDIIAGRTGGSFPGTLTRVNEPNEVVSALQLSTSTIGFGNPVAIDSGTGKIRAITAGDTTASVFGAAVKPFPATSPVWPPAGFSAAETTNPNDTQSVLRAGYIAVLVKGATAPVQGGAVYVQTVANTGLPVGCISAAADGTNNFIWVGATWAASGVDNQGFGEIRIH